MAVWEIVLLALVVLVALLFLGGFAGNARLLRMREKRLREQITVADHALAEARVGDRGWDRELLEATARKAVEARRPGVPIDRLELIQVIDLPGTDSDSAIFHVECGERRERLELVRTGDRWSAV